MGFITHSGIYQSRTFVRSVQVGNPGQFIGRFYGPSRKVAGLGLKSPSNVAGLYCFPSVLFILRFRNTMPFYDGLDSDIDFVYGIFELWLTVQF